MRPAMSGQAGVAMDKIENIADAFGFSGRYKIEIPSLRTRVQI